MSDAGLKDSQRNQLSRLAAGELAGDARREAEELLVRAPECREYYRALTAGKFPQFPNFTIIEQVGKGGFGVVYKAVHHATERIEAIKLLFSKTPLLATYFENEVHLIARLRHANIATLYDAQLSAPPLYYTMDYVEGERLNDYIRTRELSLADRVQIIQRVARAIGYAHSQGVIHRDIKPQNILVDAHQQPHIVDFGIARRLRLDEPVTGGAPSQAGKASPAEDAAREGPVGTLGYIAPEVVSGGRSDERVDIFALGALLFHCITSEPARLARDANQRDQMLRARRVSQPEDLSAIIARCVEVDPKLRYASCDEFVADLDRYLAGRAIAAREERSAARRAARMATLVIRNHPVPVRVAIAAGCAFFFTMMYFMLQSKQESYGDGASAPMSVSSTTLIGVMPSTIDALLAGDLGEEFADLEIDKTWGLRPLFGRFMERIAAAQPRVVVWDYWFRESKPELDAALINGIRALQEHGVPVVVGCGEYDLNAEPQMSREIREAVHSVGTLASADANFLPNEYKVVYAFKRGFEAPVPGLSLAAFAAARFPDSRPQYELDVSGFRINLRYRKQSAGTGAYRWEDQSDRLAVHDFDRIPPEKSIVLRKNALAVGDFVAHAHVTASPAAVWQQAAIPFETVFRWDERTAREQLIGRGVLIGAMIPGAEDEHLNANGEKIFGVFVQADALDSLMRGERRERIYWHELGRQCLLYSIAAAILVSVVRPPRWNSMRAGTIACGVCVFVGILFGAYCAVRFRDMWLVQLSLALCVMLVCGAIAYLARAFRERQMQLSPAAITWNAEEESLPSTILASRQ